MTPIVDTHCHLQDPAFPRAGVGEIVQRAAANGVRAMVVCGYDAESNIAALELATEYEGVYPAVGFHPHDADKATPAALDLVAKQAAEPAVIAVGEIGLDFYRDLSPRDEQRAALEAQLEIAIRLGKPVSVHSRSAEGDIFEPLATYASRSPLSGSSRPVGVMHCFAGTMEQARRFIEIGFLISIPCTITYPKNEASRRLAAKLPLEALVVETDSPYLPPQSLRGKRNEPANVRAAIEAIAAARCMTIDAVAETTTQNASRVFAISPVVRAA